MATALADIVSAAMIQIDDVRLTEQLTTSPAQFYRRMSAIVMQAMPLMSRPHEMLEKLQESLVSPTYGETSWVSTESSLEQETVVDTGAVNADICSVVQVVRSMGYIQYLPYPAAVYDGETGNVTFPVQEQDGTEYLIDTYSDGSFADLTPTQMRLFALAIAVVWDERFSRNWLNMTVKVQDSSFSTTNEANHTAQITKRLHDNRIAFNDELRAYEQLCSYYTVFRGEYGNGQVLM